MEQSRGKSTLNTLSICIPREYWNSIDVLFSEKCIMSYKSTRMMQKVHLGPENFSHACNILNT